LVDALAIDEDYIRLSVMLDDAWPPPRMMAIRP